MRLPLGGKVHQAQLHSSTLHHKAQRDRPRGLKASAETLLLLQFKEVLNMLSLDFYGSYMYELKSTVKKVIEKK